MSKELLLKLLKICEIEFDKKSVEEILPYGRKIAVTSFPFDFTSNFYVYFKDGEIAVDLHYHDDSYREKNKADKYLAIALRLALKVLDGKATK